eukprot:3101929-Alexandrium_andersonii.AAC.1
MSSLLVAIVSGLRGAWPHASCKLSALLIMLLADVWSLSLLEAARAQKQSSSIRATKAACASSASKRLALALLARSRRAASSRNGWARAFYSVSMCALL